LGRGKVYDSREGEEMKAAPKENKDEPDENALRSHALPAPTQSSFERVSPRKKLEDMRRNRGKRGTQMSHLHHDTKGVVSQSMSKQPKTNC